MTETESQILTLLKQSPKTWRELLPSFPDKQEMNMGMLLLEQRKQITYDLKLGVYRVV